MGLTGWKPKTTPNGREATAICVFFTLGFIVLGANPTAATYSNSRLFKPQSFPYSTVCGFTAEKQTWKKNLLDWIRRILASAAGAASGENSTPGA